MGEPRDHAITCAPRGAADSSTASARGQREPFPRLPAVGVRVVFDAGTPIEHHHRAVGTGVGGPVLAWYAGTAEGPPAGLHIVADPPRGPPVCRCSEQPTEVRAVDVEQDRKSV